MYFRLLIFYIFIVMACNSNESPDNTEVASKNTAVPLRSEIDDKYKWDMSAIYATEEAWEDDLNYVKELYPCLLYTSPSPRDKRQSRMPSSA